MHLERNTKIVATIGPASESPEMLERLIREGIDAARLNFSHGSHEEHGARIERIRKLEKKTGRLITIIADLQGPKMRVGKMPQEGLLLKDEDEIVLDTNIERYEGKGIPMPSPIFRDGARKGGKVFLDDGSLMLEIIRASGGKFTARVLRGGLLFSNKGVNVPMLELRRNILEAKDRRDLAFAAKAGADYIALSFLRNAADVRIARKLLGASPVKIIAKIERPEALEHLEEIIEAADAVMVARGDLGIETPIWELPVRQKEIIEKTHAHMKPVIVATQMLESMTKNPIPTRAEVSDVANAVYDRADAVMLSGETANGKHPAEVVHMMRHILEETEKHVEDIDMPNAEQPMPVNRSVSKSTKYIAAEIGAKIILSGTTTGFTSRAVAWHRPRTPIISFTDDARVAHSLGLVWGVTSLITPRTASVEAAGDRVIRELKKQGVLRSGDRVVFLAGRAIGEAGQTNRITVVVVS